MAKSLRSKLWRLYSKVAFGNNQNLEFSDRLIISTSLMLSILGVVTFLSNVYLGIDEIMVYSSVAVVVVFGVYFFIGRNTSFRKPLYSLVSVTATIFLNFSWYFNYGSRGSVLVGFVLLYAFLVFVWNIKGIVIVSLLLALNLICLYLLEIENPDIVGNYVSEQVRISDYYLGLGLVLILTLMFAISIKRNYINEYLEARKADQLKSAFLANMSHEVRTPLNAIVGFSSLLVEGELSSKQREEFHRYIEINNNYLLDMIEDIIDLSKIQSNEMVFKKELVDVDAMFEQLNETFQNSLSYAQKEHITIRSEVKLGNKKVFSDSDRIKQVLRSLVNNAVKFTDKGTILFGCELIDEKVTFYVKDSGTGIRKENLEKIFERFIKFEENSGTLTRGTGVGLFLSKQLVERLGGNIWVDSVYGSGASFFFTIDPNKMFESDFGKSTAKT